MRAILCAVAVTAAGVPSLYFIRRIKPGLSFRLIYTPTSVQRWRAASRQGTMNLWPLAVYVAIVGMLVVTMLSLSFVLGHRHQDRGYGFALRIWHPLGRLRASAVLGQVLSGRDVLRHLRS